jgi:hypothetical protein
LREDLDQTLALNPAGVSYPLTPQKPLPLPSKTPYPWLRVRVQKGRGKGQPNLTPGLPLPITNDIWDDMNIYANNTLEKPEKGKIHFYISDLNPSEFDMAQPSFTATIHNVKKFQSFQDVIACGSHDYSLIHCKSYIFINNNQFNKYIQVLHIISLYMKRIVGVSRDAMKQL